MMAEPFSKMRVLNPSRILDEPTVTQLLGNTEAENLTIKNPYANGNDTRCWGSPIDGHKDGNPINISTHVMCAGRCKKYVTIDVNITFDQAQFELPATNAEVENFKSGSLSKCDPNCEMFLIEFPHLFFFVSFSNWKTLKSDCPVYTRFSTVWQCKGSYVRNFSNSN